MKFFSRLSLRLQFVSLMAVFSVLVLVAVGIVGHSLVVSQSVNIGRSVADMAEHIGTWASKYGGLHVKQIGLQGSEPGSYLQQFSYAKDDADAGLLTGHGIDRQVAESLRALARTETYYWKNPALIQREISDVAALSASAVKFRLTAKSVLNPANAPNAFEVEALAAIDQKFKPAADLDANVRTGVNASSEYWKVEGSNVQYARALIATKSCLKCHSTPTAAPSYLLANPQFNGGGGFGYQEGMPAGIISVTVPLPSPALAIRSSLTMQGWIAIGAVAIFGGLFLFFVGARIIRPVNQLRIFAEKLATSQVGVDFKVPQLNDNYRDSKNEIHRLGYAVENMGRAVKRLFERLQKDRAEK